MHFPSISTTSTTSMSSTFSTTRTTLQPQVEINNEHNFDTELFSEAFFESEINDGLPYGIEIMELLNEENWENFFSGELIKRGGVWEELYEEMAIFSNKWPAIFETKEARGDALGKVAFVMGKMYRDDNFLPIRLSDQCQCDEQAARCFEHSAESGYLPALEALKELYLNGRGLWITSNGNEKKNHSYLATDILMAASLSNSELPRDTKNEKINAFLMSIFGEKDERATFQLGVVCEGLKLVKKAYSYFSDAAFNEKNQDALCKFGEDFFEGNACLRIDKIENFGEQFLTKAAEGGSERAKALLNKMYLEGRGQDAFDYFSKGSAKNISSAIYGLAVLHEKGWGGVTKNVVRAGELRKEAANEGSAEASFELAEFSLNDNESLQNCDENLHATNYLIQAAIQGHAKAAYIVGMNYLKPEGKSTSMRNQSDNKAGKFFTIAHNKKYAAATYQLGVMHEQGRVGEVDEKVGLKVRLTKAVKFFKQAALAGDLDALCKWGELCLDGLTVNDAQIVNQSFHNAKINFIKSADLGHPRAAYFLTKFYAPGPAHPSENPKRGKSEERDALFKKFYLPDEINGSKVESKWYLLRKNTMSIGRCFKINRSFRSDQEEIARFYSENQKKLYALLKIAADGGISDAQYRLGKFHQADRKSELNPSIVYMSDTDRQLIIEECFTKAAAQGHELAKIELNVDQPFLPML